MERLFFSEKQCFRQWWLWLIISVTASVSIIPFLIGIYTQEVLGKNFGNNPGSTELFVFVLILNILLVGGLILLMVRLQLTVEVRNNGLWFKFPPLSPKWKSFKKEDIAKFEIRVYRPVSEYGGWGIKGTRKNRAFNVSGNVGLQLYLKDGRKVLFGTQQKQGIERAMQKLMNSERLE
jgi:hypothetical protein